jgi:glutamine amidotransferase
MANLTSKGLIDQPNDSVLNKGVPILGICLGMQAMAQRSFEGGEYRGLGWFDADVIRLQPKNTSLRIPHIGWNEVQYRADSPLFLDLPANPDLYFVHSYYMKCNDENDVEATCEYGGIFTAAVRKKNIFATQFHPEKARLRGFEFLENFQMETITNAEAPAYSEITA